ncbi:MAG: hypothetical protein ACE5IM_05230 [Nitrospinota bacterium]
MYEQMERERREREFRAHPPASLPIWYRGTSGKVGYHMIAEPRARCGSTWQSSTATLVSGRLPAGLRLRGSRIEGTPQSPGKWQVTVRFTGIKCRGKSYPDQNVEISFNIEGFAPRRVK